MGNVDGQAVALGAASALIVIVPAMLLARLALGEDPTDGWRYAFIGVVLVSTLIGSFGAARRAPEAPMQHGALAGLTIFVIAQVLSSVVNTSVPNLVGASFFALLFMCLGAVGGFVATLGRTSDGEAS